MQGKQLLCGCWYYAVAILANRWGGLGSLEVIEQYVISIFEQFLGMLILPTSVCFFVIYYESESDNFNPD